MKLILWSHLDKEESQQPTLLLNIVSSPAWPGRLARDSGKLWSPSYSLTQAENHTSNSMRLWSRNSSPACPGKLNSNPGSLGTKSIVLPGFRIQLHPCLTAEYSLKSNPEVEPSWWQWSIACSSMWPGSLDTLLDHGAQYSAPCNSRIQLGALSNQGAWAKTSPKMENSQWLISNYTTKP